ncbi:probable long-chain-alcohol O-fatty-acyltransferase 1 [Manihot esculenta]|nr:probable long-chain-alcohol O-fatty-acyltransferase 1 [Manihot esculenta]
MRIERNRKPPRQPEATQISSKMEMDMGMELKSFIKVWVLATTCLSYCYYITARLPKGVVRLLSILPVIYIFIILPTNLTSFNLCGPTAFFLVWLANFKLLLFSFDQGPLSPPPPKLFHFISLACLPIKLKQKTDNDTNPSPHFMPRSLLLALKTFVLVLLFHIYSYRQFMHPYVILTLYCLHVYLQLELVLVISAIPARALFGFEIEPQFNEPYLATSLQDFWGHRWNLMVTSILRPTVYHPVRQFSKRLIGSTWASLPAIIATFVASGLMHEVMYFYLTRVRPTWEVTWFFILHGICVAIEVALKKVVKDRWQLHRAISGPLAVIFASITAFWLFFPQLTRNKVDEQVIWECSILLNFIKQKVSSCFIS